MRLFYSSYSLTVVNEDQFKECRVTLPNFVAAVVEQTDFHVQMYIPCIHCVL